MTRKLLKAADDRVSDLVPLLTRDTCVQFSLLISMFLSVPEAESVPSLPVPTGDTSPSPPAPVPQGTVICHVELASSCVAMQPGVVLYLVLAWYRSCFQATVVFDLQRGLFYNSVSWGVQQSNHDTLRCSQFTLSHVWPACGTSRASFQQFSCSSFFSFSRSVCHRWGVSPTYWFVQKVLSSMPGGETVIQSCPNHADMLTHSFSHETSGRLDFWQPIRKKQWGHVSMFAQLRDWETLPHRCSCWVDRIFCVCHCICTLSGSGLHYYRHVFAVQKWIKAIVLPLW